MEAATVCPVSSSRGRLITRLNEGLETLLSQITQPQALSEIKTTLVQKGHKNFTSSSMFMLKLCTKITTWKKLAP